MIDTARYIYDREISYNQVAPMRENVVKICSDNKSIALKGKLNNSSRLSDMEAISSKASELLGSDGKMVRLDICFDTDELMNHRLNKYRLLVCIVSLLLSNGLDVYNTKKLKKHKNFKYNKNNKAFTVYDCREKARNGNTRIEYRDLFINNRLSNADKIKSVVLGYNSLIDTIISGLQGETTLIDMVDSILVPILIENYKEIQAYEKTRYTSIAEYVAELDRDGYIFGKNTLDKLLKDLGYKSKTTNFIREFRRVRGKGSLNFVTKKEIIDLLKNIKKENNKILEG